MAPTARPVVGITCGTSSATGQVPRYGTNQVYSAAVEAGGGIPVMIPPAGSRPPLELLEHVDALLLPGGADIDPKFYGAARSALVEYTDPERDQLELALVRRGRKRGMPILGICRGLQMINVAYGGTLYQDLQSEGGRQLEHSTPREQGRDRIAHPVTITSRSWFAHAAGAAELDVNSLHHQAARDVGKGLEVTALSPDGVIEGLESSDRRTVAIQCHPEELLNLAWTRRLFRAFINDARR